MPPSQPSRAPGPPAPVPHRCYPSGEPAQAIIEAMSLAPPEANGPLRRERLRTARLYFVCDARPARRGPRAAAAGRAERRRRHRPAAREGAGRGARSSAPAQTFRRLCDTYSALFIVNDDPDLARACDADGVHVGQDDMPVAEAREIARARGDRRPLDPLRGADRRRRRAPGRLHQRRAVWETPTKAGPARRSASSWSRTPPRNAAHPFFAIGGIDPANAERGGRGRGAAARRGAGDPRRRGPRGGGRSAAPAPSPRTGEVAPGG